MGEWIVGGRKKIEEDDYRDDLGGKAPLVCFNCQNRGLRKVQRPVGDRLGWLELCCRSVCLPACNSS